ncbi:MAG: hypothetical protein AB7J40_02430 [Candidatus Altimarinota bacterium]
MGALAKPPSDNNSNGGLRYLLSVNGQLQVMRDTVSGHTPPNGSKTNSEYNDTDIAISSILDRLLNDIHSLVTDIGPVVIPVGIEEVANRLNMSRDDIKRICREKSPRPLDFDFENDRKPGSSRDIQVKQRMIDMILEGSLDLKAIGIRKPNSKHLKAIVRLAGGFGYRNVKHHQVRNIDKFYEGWLYNIPSSVESIKPLQDDFLVIPDPENKEKIIAFVWWEHPNGDDTEYMKKKYKGMPKNFISPDYQSLTSSLRKGHKLDQVGWMKMTAVNHEAQSRLPYEGAAELLELCGLYDLYLNPGVEHAFGEIMIHPDTNIASIKFHEMRVGVKKVGVRVQPIEGAEDVMWSVVDHPIFTEMVKEDPKRKRSLEEFIKVYMKKLRESRR